MDSWCTDSIREGYFLCVVTTQYSQAIYSPIDVFVTYDCKRAADIAVSRYAVRHLVAGEASFFVSETVFWLI